MMIILQGALLAQTQGKTITSLPEGYTWIGQATIDGWSIMPLFFVLALIFMAVFLRRTVLGPASTRSVAMPPAANSAGIRVDRTKIVAFTIAGFLAGIGGYLLASWQMAITSNQGGSFLLYAIAATIIGGVCRAVRK
ncbi:ABC transporter permease [Aurantimonas coralicida]|uniref:ABC transporter permease n=1 Tax=Aurantimonas coralicida TaxID=182270 RepID=UPI00238AD3AD|nr:hypothetical protein [Aurantimonas coralicida]MDE0923316.1 hypothetical protein [Aurantimonas coralicida]